MRYGIRVKGHLDPLWHAWLEHLIITQERDGTMLLPGFIKNQIERTASALR